MEGDQLDCLGKNKGRSYPPMDRESEEHLQAYYHKHNINLSKLLPTFKVSIPTWLRDELDAGKGD